MFDVVGKVFPMASMGIPMVIQADGLISVVKVPQRSSLTTLAPRFCLSSYVPPNSPHSFDHNSGINSGDFEIRLYKLHLPFGRVFGSTGCRSRL